MPGEKEELFVLRRFPLLLYKCAAIPRRLSIIAACERGEASLRLCVGCRQAGLQAGGSGFLHGWWLQLHGLAASLGLRKLFLPLCT